MPNRVLSPVTELDFDGIKQNLKNYLSTTTEFSDYDYEGSGMNIMLDLLAYNTHYTAMYANMLAAESFIDSAILRKSVVSLAKNLGYVPNSRNAATATVSITFGQTAGVPSTVPVGSVFLANKDGDEYVFTTTESFEIDKTSVPYKCEDIEIYQGQYRTLSFVYDTNSNSVKFEIPFANVDKDLIRVYVMKSPADLSSADFTWRENSDFLDITSTSKVYFINENYRGNYEVSFGDGIFGQMPEKGNYIVVVFFETEGAVANNIGIRDTATTPSSFEFTGIGGSLFGATVTTIAPSAGGAERDTIDKVRYAAPKYYQSQNRAVTTNDYEAIVLREYTDAESVRVWGGDENDPPEYGKVFISILPKNARILSQAQKESLINNVLNKKKVITVQAEVIDPDYTYVFVECFATYNSNIAFTSESAIRDSLRAAIVNYSDINLQIFNASFRYSILTRLLDLSNNTIVSSRISTRLAKKLVPIYGTTRYTMDFGIALNHPIDGYTSIVKTSIFKHRDDANNVLDCFIEDDGYGKLVMYTLLGGTAKVVVNANMGTINYQTGKVTLVGFAPTSPGTLPYVTFSVAPDQRYDIVPKRNQILVIDTSIPEALTINLQDSLARRI
jgi:hypothetical protein